MMAEKPLNFRYSATGSTTALILAIKFRIFYKQMVKK